MSTKEQFDLLAFEMSALATKSYSTSFSLSVRFLPPDTRQAIHAIYGFVRFADEIVDSFHTHDKRQLLEAYRLETLQAIERGISLNPLLNSFQCVLKRYQIPLELITSFFDSMEMDLSLKKHVSTSFDAYVFGSAEVVGLMCLHVFSQGNKGLVSELKEEARALGAAFQKVNFLRDMQSDHQELGRVYFPGVHPETFDEVQKKQIEQSIEVDFSQALSGIRKLPRNVQFSVYLAYTYYFRLFRKIQRCTVSDLLKERIRISNRRKVALLISSYLRMKFHWL